MLNDPTVQALIGCLYVFGALCTFAYQRARDTAVGSFLVGLGWFLYVPLLIGNRLFEVILSLVRKPSI